LSSSTRYSASKRVTHKYPEVTRVTYLFYALVCVGEVHF